MIWRAAKGLYFLTVIFIIFNIIGCSRNLSRRYTYPVKKRGVYHIVKKGDTLWKISNQYHADIEDIAKANRIYNPKQLAVGQKLFIPRTTSNNSAPPRRVHTPAKIEDFIWPVKGKVVSRFGKKLIEKNNGIDIKAEKGSDIIATASGKVIFSEIGPDGYGKMIIIKHSAGFVSLYANNYENLVQMNQYVRQGQRIARVGIPKNANEPILHFEIRKNRIPKNPLYYLP